MRMTSELRVDYETKADYGACNARLMGSAIIERSLFSTRDLFGDIGKC